MLLPSKQLTINEQLEEFDQWMTAELGTVKEAPLFKEQVEATKTVIEVLASYFNAFEEGHSWEIDHIAKAVNHYSRILVQDKPFFEAINIVEKFHLDLFELLFLSTGNTDNNLKNHFVIRLKNDGLNAEFPILTFANKRKIGNGKEGTFRLAELPSVLGKNRVAGMLSVALVATTEPFSKYVQTSPAISLTYYYEQFLREYMKLLLPKREERLQLWAVCRAYMLLNTLDQESDFGQYLIKAASVFKLRGSITASSGHDNERIMRDKLSDLGLIGGIEFNLADVNVTDLPLNAKTNYSVAIESEVESKTRGFDFILPFAVPEWGDKARLFIQAQFYAGDSGSVSHKVVDQTRSSRDLTKTVAPNSRFVEYLDGAGYYAALRGDLRHMLQYDDTASFIQVKSILIRLRRGLQEIAFITPIEVEHSILRSISGSRAQVETLLIAEGYPLDEVERAISRSLGLKYINENKTTLSISDERYEYARRLLLLDLIALNGSIIEPDEDAKGKYLMVPGYGAHYGVLQSDLGLVIDAHNLQHNYSLVDFEKDIEWLIDEGVVVRW